MRGSVPNTRLLEEVRSRFPDKNANIVVMCSEHGPPKRRRQHVFLWDYLVWSETRLFSSSLEDFSEKVAWLWLCGWWLCRRVCMSLCSQDNQQHGSAG